MTLITYFIIIKIPIKSYVITVDNILYFKFDNLPIIANSVNGLCSTKMFIKTTKQW